MPNAPLTVADNNIITCITCKIEMKYCKYDSVYICNMCGHISHVSQIIEDKTFYDENSKYHYKKINHFTELLNKYKSKEASPHKKFIILDDCLPLKPKLTSSIPPMDFINKFKKHPKIITSDPTICISDLGKTYSDSDEISSDPMIIFSDSDETDSDEMFVVADENQLINLITIADESHLVKLPATSNNDDINLLSYQGDSYTIKI